MLTKEAIQELALAQAIEAANKAVNRPSAVALPDTFGIHDLEQYLPNRRRLRGHMETSVIGDFAGYVAANKEPGARVFVNQQQMHAVAVLNIGTPTAPGHADNTATYKLQQTAAFKALGSIATGQPLTQQRLAEFLEDWIEFVWCARDSAVVPTMRAISAIRAITIEKLQKVASEEQQLSASRSAFESVKAEGNDIPALIQFRTVPYQGLAERNFTMRLAIITEGKAPSLTLRIVKAEEHAEQMATELANLVRGAIDTDVPVLIGSYTVKN